jgi:pimeloyl-ACP methyl ester carboxylesterase
MPLIHANAIDIEVERFGDPSHPAVLLIMGLGMQLVAWPMEFCTALADAGYHVIRFDNRDIGLSSKWQGRHTPVALAALRFWMRLPVHAPYRIDTLAADSIGLLDALGICRAHIVGVSMGGMIAQTLTARHPDRVLSLTSIMSSSGSRYLPNPSLGVLRLMLARPPARSQFDRQVAHFMRLFKAIGSPGFPIAPEQMRERIASGLHRSYHPAGTARQLLAIAASGDRSGDLRSIARPTLVIHGDADRLVPLAHGIDCARKIKGAQLRVVEGMGHDLAPGLLPILIEELLAHWRRTATGA